MIGQAEGRIEVEIWADVICPFCYMGKRKLEIALEDFAHRSEVILRRRSFQLDQEFERGTGDIHDYLATKYSKTREWAKAVHEDLTRRAGEVGLEYNFDSIIPSNTFDAHRLIHMANMHGSEGRAEEELFASYFTRGMDISDHGTLTEIGASIGLDRGEIVAMLEGEEFTREVRQDIAEAETLGINGVPFFVFNRKYAISGAQPSHLFLETLEKMWNELPGEVGEEDRHRKPAS